jgi:hypothetical protein
MAWLRAVAGFQVFRGGRFWVFGDTQRSSQSPHPVIDIRRNS